MIFKFFYKGVVMEGIEVKILELRKSGFSIKEITEMLSTEEY